MGGFEEALRRAVADDELAFRHTRREWQAADERRARVRSDNERAVEQFVAERAASREPGLRRWKVRSRAGFGGWHRRGGMSGWAVDGIIDENGHPLHYFVRDDGTVFTALWIEGIDGGGVGTVLNPEPADLGARTIVHALGEPATH